MDDLYLIESACTVAGRDVLALAATLEGGREGGGRREGREGGGGREGRGGGRRKIRERRGIIKKEG